MHIFFSGIGGTGLGPLALIAKEAGYDVSGSDKQDSQYIHYLKQKGIDDIHIGQTYDNIAKVHDRKAIDWFVFSSAVAIENPDSDELRFCRNNDIKQSKRDLLINEVLATKNLNLLAVAGTHGKSTTTAMLIWLFQQLNWPISYAVGAKLNFADMGQYDEKSKYFIYEADEFDRNFLSFEPFISVITGVSWDHHEIFPTREDYQQAFVEFISQTLTTIIWQEDSDYLRLGVQNNLLVQNSADAHIAKITLKGLYNRLNAWLSIQAVHLVTKEPLENLVSIVNRFPGLSRRMEEIMPNLYSDYAHTPEKIKGAVSTATEIASENNQAIVVVYEPLTNRRQHFMLKDYKDCFEGVSKIYWLPSYLAREDPKQRIIEPSELISYLDDPSVAEPMKRDSVLKRTIEDHLKNKDMVVCIAGGGGNSLDEWIRTAFKKA